MNYSKILASAAIVLVASLVITTEASGPKCRGYRCQPAYLPTGPAPQHRAPHGPYHSYLVRPAVYGGPHLYTYRGYARHPLPLAPVAVHLKAAAYSPYSHAPIVAPLTLAIEAPAHPECHGYNCPPPSHYNAGKAPALRPVKAVLLAPIVAAPVYPKSTGHQQAASYSDAHTALAGPLYRAEIVRPAAYGSGHYYQALETLKAQGAYRPAHKSAGPSAGGY